MPSDDGKGLVVTNVEQDGDAADKGLTRRRHHRIG